MKKSIVLSAAMALLVAVTAVWAAPEPEITITGDGKCAKCALKETKECQNAVSAKKDGKDVTYYLVQNDVSKKFHSEVCTDTKKLTATGTVKEVDGKMQFTATKIELVKAN